MWSFINSQEDYDEHCKFYEAELGKVLPLSCYFRNQLVTQIMCKKLKFSDAQKLAKLYYDNRNNTSVIDFFVNKAVNGELKFSEIEKSVNDYSNSSNHYNAISQVRVDSRVFTVYGLIRDKGRRYALFVVSDNGYYVFDTYTNIRGYLKSGYWQLRNITFNGSKLEFMTPIKEYENDSPEFKAVLHKIQNHMYNLGDKL